MVPVTAPPKLTAAVGAPLHNVWLVTVFTVGVGLIVIVNVLGVPKQPPAEGVTVMVDVMGVVPAFTVTNGLMLPDPEAARPMAVLLFVQP